MKYSIHMFTTVIIFTTIIIGGVIVVPSNTPYSIWNTGGNGYSELAARYGFKPLHDIPSNILEKPGDTVILYPVYKPIVEKYAVQLREYVRRGGRLILVDSNGYVNQLLHLYFEIPLTIGNATVYDEIIRYRDRSEPVASWGNISIVAHKPHYIEVPTTINYTEQSFHVRMVWSTSEYSYIDLDGNEYYTSGDVFGSYPIVVVVDYSNGSVVVLSDPDILSNEYIDLNNLFVERILLVNGSINHRYILLVSSDYSTLEYMKEIIVSAGSTDIVSDLVAYIIVLMLALTVYLGDRYGVWR